MPQSPFITGAGACRQRGASRPVMVFIAAIGLLAAILLGSFAFQLYLAALV